MAISKKLSASYIIGLGIAGSLLLASPGFAADAAFIVSGVSGAPFKEGDPIAADAKISLAAGQSIDLISADGTALTLKGPFNGTPTTAGQTKTASVADMVSPLFKKAETEKATPGVIRNGAGADPTSDPWVIDSTQSGNVCIHQAVEYDVWRPESKDPATLILASTTGDKASLAFAADKTRVGVPDSFNFKDGAQYKISGPGGSNTITVHTIPETVPTNSKITAAWFVQQHCQQQALALAKWLVASNDGNH